jgi:outer membrane protein OmpA-like peptidoglycan-associated protein
MLTRDIFSQACWILVLLGLSGPLTAQREDIKFGLPQLDTALTIWSADQINSEGAQFSPTYFRNGLLFVYGKKAHPLDYEEGKVFYKIRYAPLSPDGEPTASISFPLSDLFNAHLGPLEYVDSIQSIFISKTETQDISSKYSKAGAPIHLYQSIWQDSSWQPAHSLSINDSLANSFHPTLSADGKLLIFSSDRSADNDSYNLFASEWNEGQWSTPYLLNRVNSEAHEAFPQLYQNKYLFFSSDRKGGRGDYDFYLSIRRPSGWTAPINLGAPFNSDKDDIGIDIHPNGKKGFFSSNRAGSDNIYGFISSLHLFKEELPDRSIDITVVNQSSGMRLEGVKIWLFDYSPDGGLIQSARYESKIVEQPDVPGLTIETRKKSAAALGAPTATTNRNGQTRLRLKPKNSQTTLLAYKKGFVEWEGQLDYFSVDSSLQLKLEELICVPLEIKAVGLGDKRINDFDVFIQNLSDNQVQSFSMPLTERICIAHNKAYEIIASRPGALSDTFHIEPQTEDIKKVAVLFRLLPRLKAGSRNFESTQVEELKEGVTLKLNNIYYDFNQAQIRDGAEEELIRLADIMKAYPAMEIELAAHTDSRGRAAYNLRLSQRRAEAAKRILVREGVASRRIQARGYGETQLKNDCIQDVNCTEEQHQENRRTEIRILKAPRQVQIKYRPSPDE